MEVLQNELRCRRLPVWGRKDQLASSERHRCAAAPATLPRALLPCCTPALPQLQSPHLPLMPGPAAAAHPPVTPQGCTPH